MTRGNDFAILADDHVTIYRIFAVNRRVVTKRSPIGRKYSRTFSPKKFVLFISEEDSQRDQPPEELGGGGERRGPAGRDFGRGDGRK